MIKIYLYSICSLSLYCTSTGFILHNSITAKTTTNTNNNDNDNISTTTTSINNNNKHYFSLSIDTTVEKNDSLMKTIHVIQVDEDEDENNNNVKKYLPPVLQEITNERKNFQMNLGKAMDTLRKDMPSILKKMPGKIRFGQGRDLSLQYGVCIAVLLSCFFPSADSFFFFFFSPQIDLTIYHDEIMVVDPSGVQITGIENYKNSIKFMQQFMNFWFQEKRNGLQYRLVYDFARSSIKVSWHVTLIPKMPLGKRTLHVDGISMYKLDPDSGKIMEHKFETMSINNTPIVPPYGVFSLVQQEWGLAGGVGTAGGIPALFKN